MSRHLEGQVAIITGASSGIGRALARELAAEGAYVALVARRAGDLQSLAAEIVGAGGQALAIPGDVTAPDDMAHVAQAVLKAWDRIDILVANAGIYVQGMAADLTVADLERAMDVNFFGAARAVFAVLPTMRVQGSGHLVFMSTQDVMIPIPGDGPYVASKSALTGWAQTLRQELKPDGIRVTVIHPGRIDTPLIEHLRMPLASPKVPAKGLAQCTVRSIVRGRRRLIYPASGYLCTLRDLWPALGDWLIGALRLQGWPATRTDEEARNDPDDRG